MPVDNLRIVEYPEMHHHTRPTGALLAHPGTQYSFELAKQLELNQCLLRFWTGLAYTPTSGLARWIAHLPKQLRRKLTNRQLEGVPSEKLRVRAVGELRALRRLFAGHDDQNVMFARNEAFQLGIPLKELAESKVVIGFDTSSWILAQRAASLQRPFILDQSIAHIQAFGSVSEKLRRQFPDWADNLAPRLPKLLVAEKAEHTHASLIVAASSFTKRTLIENGISANKIYLNPYGVDLSKFRPAIRQEPNRPLRFAFLGYIAARKGVPLLLQAWKTINHRNAELWMIGPTPRNHPHISPLPGLKLLGKQPHRDLPHLLRQCDVLVFPSYFEGFGLVLLEALATGMPIISTDATAAPDLITEGVEGHVIPAGDFESLRTVIQSFIDSRDKVARMSAAARRCAEQYSWDAYGKRWASLLRRAV